MSEDPYRTLGVSPTASEDEITQAYRRLAKKYHPDINPNDPASEKKMKEINAAYETIKSGKGEQPQYGQSQSYGGQYAQYGYGQNRNWEDIFGDIFGRGYGQNTGSRGLEAVREMLNDRRFQDALRLLSEIPVRSARWYYFSAIAHAGIGNRVTAVSHAKEAVRLDPDNFDYQSLLGRLERSVYEYRNAGTGFGFNMTTVGKTLAGLWLAQFVALFCCRGCF